MALKNRQSGEVKIFVGTDKLDNLSKNVIEFDELALKTDIPATATKASIVNLLGIKTAVDDTAAAALTPSIPVGGLYYTGTVFQTRQA